MPKLCPRSQRILRGLARATCVLSVCVGRTTAAASLLRPVSLAPERSRALHSGQALALARRHALYAGVQLRRGTRISAPSASMHALGHNQGPSVLHLTSS